MLTLRRPSNRAVCVTVCYFVTLKSIGMLNMCPYYFYRYHLKLIIWPFVAVFYNVFLVNERHNTYKVFYLDSLSVYLRFFCF